MRPGEKSGISSGVSCPRRWAWVCAVLLVVLPFVAGAADIKVFTVAEGLPSNWVTALASAPDGKLWIGTGNAGVYVIDPATGKGKGYRIADGLSSDAVVSVSPFGGKIYVGTANGLSVFDGGSWKTIDKVENVTMRNVRLAASPDGSELWASAVILAGGVVRFDGKEWKFMGGEGRGLFNDVQGFAFLPDGVLMGAGSGVPYLHKGTDVVSSGDGLPPANILCAASWHGKAYLGTSRGLFVRDGKWREASVPRGIGGIPVFSLVSGGNSLLAGTAAGMVKVSEEGTAVLSARDGLPASRILAVASGNGYVAAGTANGLAIVREW
jgi:ligand-binding sensor domain-containing protein